MTLQVTTSDGRANRTPCSTCLDTGSEQQIKNKRNIDVYELRTKRKKKGNKYFGQKRNDEGNTDKRKEKKKRMKEEIYLFIYFP
jgi:hypothetical protein